MKKLIILALISVLGIVIYSCSSNKEDQIQHIVSNSNCGDWNEIGQLHNDGLEGYFLFLKNSNIEVIAENREVILEDLENYVLDFYPIIQAGVFPPHYPISESLHSEILNLVIDNFEEINNVSSNFIYDQILSAGYDQLMVNNVRGLFAIYDDPTNQDSYSNMSNELNNYKSELTDLGQWNNVLDDGFNVAKATFCFWKENSDKWNKQFASNKSTSRDFIGNGRADITGAIIGGLTGDGPGAVGAALFATAGSLLWDLFGE